jgi:hypothetical protein
LDRIRDHGHGVAFRNTYGDGGGAMGGVTVDPTVTNNRYTTGINISTGPDVAGTNLSIRLWRRTS